ncbi:acyltransferase family protein [Diaminobutyricibacter sp. McL0618]|uniref:acyltransferase family protein n=1 Tax=Leifsonia sp. McL0618 TaxID=3415677 RepID=UPI003CF78A8E
MAAANTTMSVAADLPRTAANRFRPEIQGLRTIAVLAVVLYHLWPARLPGGFVGVDIFFVISGYLISSHLFRELEGLSRIRFVAFWGRRIRRLLPVALFVLAVSLIAVFIWAPATVWEPTARQVAASAFYVENWVLASDAVDYSALHAGSTVATHYWSLSVEEQFYVFWPLILVGLFALGAFLRKASAQRKPSRLGSPKTVLVWGLGVIGVLSLGYSVYITSIDSAAAYFVTPARVWEFTVGALVALITIRPLPAVVKAALSWAGLAMVAAALLTFNAGTPFPGYTALLPTVGTALVLMFCRPGVSFGPWRLLSIRPMTFVGDISYGAYLWHWPLIIVLPYILGHDLGTLSRVGILAATIVLAWGTKVLLEDPLRTGRLLRTNRRTYAFALSSMLAVAAMCIALVMVPTGSVPLDAAARAEPCYGPGALNPYNKCSPVTGKDSPNPSPAQVASENHTPRYPGCQADYQGSNLVSCTLGASVKDAAATVAIVGDSHAVAWFPAIEALARTHNWHVVTFAKASCPVSFALRVLPNESTASHQKDCSDWVARLNTKLLDDPSISRIFTASFSSAYTFTAPKDRPMADPATQGFEDVWKGWISAGKKVDVFDDVPRTSGAYVPDCLAQHPAQPMACAVPLAQGIPANMNITRAAHQMASHGITELSLLHQFCDATWCYPQVGSVIVYRDYSHLSADYSRALAPYIDAQLTHAR